MMSLTVPQLLVMLGAALLGVALFAPRKPAALRLPAIARVAPAGIEQSTNESASSRASQTIVWPALVDPSAQALEPSQRRALFASLLAIDEPWCVPILATALTEEPELAAVAAGLSASSAARRDAA